MKIPRAELGYCDTTLAWLFLDYCCALSAKACMGDRITCKSVRGRQFIKKTVRCVHTVTNAMKTATNVRMMEMVGWDEFPWLGNHSWGDVRIWSCVCVHKVLRAGNDAVRMRWDILSMLTPSPFLLPGKATDHTHKVTNILEMSVLYHCKIWRHKDLMRSFS